MRHSTNNFAGQSGFYHFFGIVEDRNDPKKLGRLKVRCYGIHSDDLTVLPTKDLPWAQVIVPVDSTPGAVPNVWEGDMVFGFFADGREMQVPVIMGTVSTNKGGGNPSRGFSDQRKTAAVDIPGGNKSSYSARQSSPGTNFMATGKYDGTYVKTAKKPLTGIKVPGGGTKSEPPEAYGAKYPYNHAEVTESGHVIEFDDTPGAERIHIMHRSGAFWELRADGSMFFKSPKNSDETVLGNKFTYVKGTNGLTNDGAFNHLSGGSYTLEVASGNMKVDVKGGNLNLTVNGNVNQNVTGNMTAAVGGSYNVQAGGAVNIAGATVNIKGGRINLN